MNSSSISEIIIQIMAVVILITLTKPLENDENVIEIIHEISLNYYGYQK